MWFFTSKTALPVFNTPQQRNSSTNNYALNTMHSTSTSNMNGKFMVPDIAASGSLLLASTD